MPNKKNILHNINEPLNEEQLLNYVANNLQEEETYALELEMQQNEFMNDAVEGLQSFKEQQHIQSYVNELNKQLVQQTTKKKNRRNKRKLKDQDWIVITTLIIIMLCILGYIVIKKMQ